MADQNDRISGIVAHWATLKSYWAGIPSLWKAVAGVIGFAGIAGGVLYALGRPVPGIPIWLWVGAVVVAFMVLNYSAFH
jgi:hypothetical protein